MKFEATFHIVGNCGDFWGKKRVEFVSVSRLFSPKKKRQLLIEFYFQIILHKMTKACQK
jgi:hypothetical protein